MPFPYRDAQESEPFVLGYFERLRANDDIRRTWLGLDALVQVLSEAMHNPASQFDAYQKMIP